MSGRIDTPLANPAPPRSADARAARLERAALEASRTVWLNDPIDLRLAVDRLEAVDRNGSDPSEPGIGAAEIARQLHPSRANR